MMNKIVEDVIRGYMRSRFARLRLSGVKSR